MLRSARWALVWTLLRGIVAVLIGAAVIAQAVASIGGAAAGGRDVVTTAVNFFSFFTILSNVVTVVVLTWAVVWFLSKKRDGGPEPRSLAIAIAAASTYMIVTGIVYNVLLRNIVLPLGGQPIPWSNEVVHLIGPLFMLADVFLAPHRRVLRWRAIAAILVFPIVWVVYTLIRGPLTTSPLSGDPWWYPYPFLNPNVTPGGYLGVAAYVVGISIAIALVATFVVWMTRRRGSLAVAEARATPVAAAG